MLLLIKNQVLVVSVCVTRQLKNQTKPRRLYFRHDPFWVPVHLSLGLPGSLLSFWPVCPCDRTLGKACCVCSHCIPGDKLTDTVVPWSYLPCHWTAPPTSPGTVCVSYTLSGYHVSEHSKNIELHELGFREKNYYLSLSISSSVCVSHMNWERGEVELSEVRR